MTDLLLLASSAAFALGVGLGVGPLLSALNGTNHRFFDDLARQMSGLGMSTRALPALASLRWVIAAGWVVGLSVAGMAPIGLFLGALSYNLMAVWLVWRVDAYRTRIRDQLVVVARDFSNQVRAGLPLAGGLEATCRELPPPLGPLLQRVVQQAKQGPGYFLTALEDLKNTVRLDGLTIFVLAVTVAHERGGNLSRVLDRLSYSLEELQRVERKKDSETAAGNLVVWLLSAFPFAFLILFYVMDPEGTGLLFSLVRGQILLSAIGIVVYVSFRWAQSIIRKVE